jgi:hypothetical protein
MNRPLTRQRQRSKKYIREQIANPLPPAQGAFGSAVSAFSQDIVPSVAGGIAQTVATPIGAAAGPAGAIAANIGSGMATYAGTTALQREIADKIFGEGSQQALDDQLRAKRDGAPVRLRHGKDGRKHPAHGDWRSGAKKRSLEPRRCRA